MIVVRFRRSRSHFRRRRSRITRLGVHTPPSALKQGIKRSRSGLSAVSRSLSPVAPSPDRFAWRLKRPVESARFTSILGKHSATVVASPPPFVIRRRYRDTEPGSSREELKDELVVGSRKQTPQRTTGTGHQLMTPHRRTHGAC